jgi:hypothetical protein
MSHSTDGLIGTTTHHNPHLQQPPMYGTPKYPSIYGGSPYYPPPPYQKPYLVALPPPISGPPLAPIVHLETQPNSGTPSTSSYTLSTNKRATLSYVPYRSLPQNNLYFQFPGPPQSMAPQLGHQHAEVNFFQPFPVQQYQNFKTEYDKSDPSVKQFQKEREKMKQ